MTNVSKSLSQKMASIMMLDESVIEAKLNAMLCLGLDDMVQWMTMLTYKYEDINKRYESLSQKIMDTRNMNPEKLIQTNFEDNHGVVISGGNNSISIKISKDGVEMEKQPAPKSAVDILDRAVKAKIDSNATPKNILMPVRAAMEVPIPLPFNNVVEFNKRYGCEISSSTWSRCIKDTEGCGYDSKEINSYIAMFSTI